MAKEGIDFTAPNYDASFGGFTSENILDQNKLNELSGMLKIPSWASVDRKSEIQTNRAMYPFEQMSRYNADLQFENQMQGANAQEEQAKIALAQRGLSMSGLGQEQAAPAIVDAQIQKQAAREGYKSIIGEQRAMMLEGLKAKFAQQQIESINKDFQRKQRNFQREFQKYNETTQAKFGKELRNARIKMQRDSDNAWKNIELTLQKNKRIGGIAGGIFGGTIGAIATAYTGNPMFLTGGIALGRSAGSAIGTGVGSKKARAYI